MPTVTCIKCQSVIGEESNNRLNLSGKNVLKDKATFGCDVCGTLITWIAGQGTKLADEWRRTGNPAVLTLVTK